MILNHQEKRAVRMPLQRQEKKTFTNTLFLRYYRNYPKCPSIHLLWAFLVPGISYSNLFWKLCITNMIKDSLTISKAKG